MAENLERTRRELQTLAAVLDEHFNADRKPKTTSFVLLVMPFDAPEGSRVNYASNSNRKDVTVMMKEVLARFEGQPEQKGTA